MRIFAIAALTLCPNIALAHMGHLGDMAGHDHWLGAAALGIALGAAVIGVLGKGKTKDAEADAEEPQVEEEAQEA